MMSNSRNTDTPYFKLLRKTCEGTNAFMVAGVKHAPERPTTNGFARLFDSGGSFFILLVVPH